MRRGWRIILIIVIIAVIIGAVSAGVGFLTGAEPERINNTLVTRIEDQFNVDPIAFVHEWLPETADILLHDWLPQVFGGARQAA